jgi:Fic family protein
MEKHFYFDKMIATVHLKEGSDGILAHWFVSGPGDLWMIRLLLELKLKSPSSSINEALEMAEEVAKTHIFPLAQISGQNGGVLELSNSDDYQNRLELADAHIRMHTERESLVNSDSLLFETAQLYFIAKGFGVKNAVSYVAQKLDVPLSTITRRLARCRDEGLIVKQRNLKVVE